MFRESAVAPIALMLRRLRQMGVVNFGLIAVFASRAIWAIPLALVVLLAVTVVEWWRRTYQLVGDDIIVDSGILSRTRKTIPLEKVQAVAIDQPVIQRALGVQRVRVETAGSAGTELEMQAIGLEHADALRRLASQYEAAATTPNGDERVDGAAPAAPVAEPTVVLFTRSFKELLKVAATSNPLLGLGAGIAAFIGLGSEFGERFIDEDAVESAFESVITNPVAIAVAVTLFVVFFIAASTIATVVPLHDLTLTRTGTGLRSNAGLLSRRERVASLERIQAIAIEQSVLQRMAGISTVHLPTVGLRQSAGEGNANDGAIRLPGTPSNDIETLRDLIVGESTPWPPLGNGISPAAIGRWILWGGVIPAAVGAAALVAVIGPWVALFAAWPLVMVPLARRTQRRWRWELSPEALAVTNGLFATSSVFVAVRKVQTVALERNWFHRRRGLATVQIITAARTVTIPHLRFDIACTLRDELIFRTQTDPRPWT